MFGMSEGEPVRVPQDVLEGLEAVRRYAARDVLDIAWVRYLAQERGQSALAVWVASTRTSTPGMFSTASAQTSGGSALGRGLRVPLVVVSRLSLVPRAPPRHR